MIDPAAASAVPPHAVTVAEPLPGRRWMLGVLLFAAIATPAYWIIWFSANRSWIAVTNTPVYLGYENAFPLPDAWMTLASACGALALYRRRATALLWMLCAGSTSIFLALADTLFDLENGIYTGAGGDLGGVIVEACVNMLTFAGGLAALIWAWKHRRALLSLERSE